MGNATRRITEAAALTVGIVTPSDLARLLRRL
jgi:hypothetical protein